MGSCIYIYRNDEWWAATAAHNVRNADWSDIGIIAATDGIGFTAPRVDTLRVNQELDIAAFQVDRNTRTMPMKYSSAGVGIGTFATLLGYPHITRPHSEQRVQMSIPKSGVATFFNFKEDGQFWLIGVQGNKGYSGGPVCTRVDGDSHIIGMVLRTTADEKDRALYGHTELMPVKEDAGWTWAVDIKHVLGLVDGTSTAV